MNKNFWTVAIAVACAFWGTAVLFNQHHLSALIPALGSYLLTFGVGLLALFFWHERRKS